MKAKQWKQPSDDGMAMWWRALTTRQKLYVAYFYVSFLLVLGMADTESLGVLFAAVLNFGNSVWLIRKVPMDKLED